MSQGKSYRFCSIPLVYQRGQRWRVQSSVIETGCVYECKGLNRVETTDEFCIRFVLRANPRKVVTDKISLFGCEVHGDLPEIFDCSLKSLRSGGPCSLAP